MKLRYVDVNFVNETAIVKLLGLQTAGRVASTCEYNHHVHTPFPLCHEIWEKMDLGSATTILIMFNIEFVHELAKYSSFLEKKVYFYTTDVAKEKLVKVMYKNVVLINYLEFDMKFSRIVGNPPFQDATAKSSKKSWDKFVDKAMDKLEDNGYLGFITPVSWVSGKNGVFDYFKNYQCTFLCLDGKHYFKDVGTTISYYVINKTQNKYPVITKEGYNIDFSKFTSLPVKPDTTTLSILTKLFSAAPIGVMFDSQHSSGNKDKVKEKQDNIFIYVNKHTATQERYTAQKHKCVDIKKVLFPISSAMKAEYDEGGFGITQHYAYIPVGSAAEGDACVKYLHSKLIKWLRVATSTSASWDKDILKKIPAIPLSHIMTATELYTHFGLTDEEINLIETTVK